MTADDIVTYINRRLNTPVGRSLLNKDYTTTEGLCLSPAGEKSVRERFNKSENEGGYSSYWKNISIGDL